MRDKHSCSTQHTSIIVPQQSVSNKILGPSTVTSLAGADVPECSASGADGVTQILVFEQAAEQQAAHFLHGVFRGEDDGGDEVVLLTAALDLAQKVLPASKEGQCGAQVPISNSNWQPPINIP